MQRLRRSWTSWRRTRLAQKLVRQRRRLVLLLELMEDQQLRLMQTEARLHPPHLISLPEEPEHRLQPEPVPQVIQFPVPVQMQEPLEQRMRESASDQISQLLGLPTQPPSHPDSQS
jgi:hypothetical protein